MRNNVLLGLLLIIVSIPVYAGISTTLYTAKIADCNVVVSHDSVKGGAGTLVIRARSKASTYCHISQAVIQAALGTALKTLKAKKQLSPITNVFLANKLRSYPWISKVLVEKSMNNPQWNKKAGKPKSGTANRYVNKILYTTAVLIPFSQSLKQYQYTISAVSCEKILINKNNLPYEAMCWLKIKKISTP
ncbi:hypothetical protein MNBD_GAMMA12-3146 [hydrothermal vent metagenome]|uniref:Uncharacterized protein n=1 Tax=hydrothermal vent metagenome TaxID=652676 RepID=A0A3B0YVF6_9ZZZZ